MKAFLENLKNSNARMERVILLAGAIAGDSFPDDLSQFFEDEDEQTIRATLGYLPEWLDDIGDEESLIEWLTEQEKLGFLVQFATPVIERRSNGMVSGNWGHFRTNWVYGDTMEQAVVKGIAWVETVRSREQEEAKKGGA